MNIIHRRKVAIVVSSVGFHWEELAAAVRTLSQAAVEIYFFTPSGKPPLADPKSLVPRRFLSHLGIGSPLDIAPKSEFGKELIEKLKTSRSIVELNPNDYSGLYLPGGHGCVFDLNISPAVQNRVLDFFQAGKPLAAVCHATSTFAFTQNQGVQIVEGKFLTGFPNLMDEILVQLNAVDPSFLPIPFSNEGKLIASGAKLPILHRIMALLNPKYYIVDLPFITGVGPKSAAPVAQKLLEQLK